MKMELRDSQGCDRDGPLQAEDSRHGPGEALSLRGSRWDRRPRRGGRSRPPGQFNLPVKELRLGAWVEPCWATVTCSPATRELAFQRSVSIWKPSSAQSCRSRDKQRQ